MADDVGSGVRTASPRLTLAFARAPLLTQRPRLLAALAVALLLATGFMVHWQLVGRYLVSTENAYVRADISMLSAKVEGYVRAIPKGENQPVHAGDVLIEIEPIDYQTQLAAAQAALAQAQGQLASERASQAQANADLERSRELSNRGFLSHAGWDAAVARARQATGGQASANAAVQAARAQIAAAQVNLERTTIRSPIDGVVGDRQVQLGQLVRSGSPLLAVVPVNAVYVVANFKETQISHLHAGQPVTIVPDVEQSIRLRGVVDSLAPASGSQFSIIPTDTATGNFTKIVQRVPVRIRIEPGQDGVAMLRPGLSATVTVNTK